MAKSQESAIGTITAWVGVLSSVITIVLTGYNAIVKAKIDTAGVEVQKTEERLKILA